MSNGVLSKGNNIWYRVFDGSTFDSQTQQMKKNTNYDYDTGLFFIAHVIGWILKLVLLILYFPIRVILYRINPLNQKRIRIEK